MTPATAETRQYLAKRERILDAAAALVNSSGVRALSIADVADSVGLGTTSITYYFRRKELLVAACFDRALDRLDRLVSLAEQEPDAERRVTRYVEENFAMLGRVARGEETPVARLSDLRALDEPLRGQLIGRYLTIYRRVRHFWDSDGSPLQRARQTARAHILLDTVFWMPAWLPLYDPRDYGRVCHRLLELLRHGLLPAGAPAAGLETGSLQVPDLATSPFLAAAIRLINTRGYKGASVDLIAAELGVTKGSFYHHLDGKDDLVQACFEQSFQWIDDAQRQADAAGGPHGERLVKAMLSLVTRQLSPSAAPLLRNIALHTLPQAISAQVMAKSRRITARFAGTMIDGITDGSIRPIDPWIAAQTLMVTLNAAYELRHWAARCGLENAMATYAQAFLFGLFNE
ncbi:TetR/AcrR family transcriptional regulator [Zavarzinia aquatilis]|uniref:TetR/AcrR family transcriptional regulator n=1 Tax=Zavarzinia aquatilis TaxID=2211142 RepID=A0A317EEI9_9PROT|nr:TetR/AcrR family transcriptional regulator [Zavarzinia aquatilis]PWR25339.1 TetR/AcrR family transcriptional regulator [Zavarzinia aquatilis]